MTKASDNPFPSALLVEGSTPASPASGNQRVFIDSADHKFKRVNSSGTVTIIEGGGGGGSSEIVLISETIFAGSTGTTTISSIPGTYKDLQLVIWGRAGSGSTISRAVNVQFNGDTTSGHYLSEIYFIHSGSGGNDASHTADMYLGVVAGDTAPAGYSGQSSILIPSYARTDFNKTCSGVGAWSQGTTEVFNAWFAGHWLSTAAITSITVALISGNFASGSTVRLYGLN